MVDTDSSYTVGRAYRDVDHTRSRWAMVHRNGHYLDNPHPSWRNQALLDNLDSLPSWRSSQTLTSLANIVAMVHMDFLV